jgi:hypothetical protein
MTRMTLVLAGVSLFAAFCASAVAQTQPASKRGDHPALIVKRLHAQRAYDYAAQFYPHPAWLYLRAGPDVEALAKIPVTPLQPPRFEVTGITQEMALARADVE